MTMNDILERIKEISDGDSNQIRIGYDNICTVAEFRQAAAVLSEYIIIDEASEIDREAWDKLGKEF